MVEKTKTGEKKASGDGSKKNSRSVKNSSQKEQTGITAQEEKELQKMFEAGLHYGRRVSKKHPKMEPYIFGIRNTINVINLLKAREALKEAANFLRKNKDKKILFVGIDIPAKSLVEKTAQSLDMPYAAGRWIGGTLTNFDVIFERVKYLKEMEKKIEQEEFKQRTTKRERLGISREMNKIREKSGGLKNLERLPDVLFVVDVAEAEIAVREARMMDIPVVGICNTNANPDLVDYPIPANTDSASSIKYILERVKTKLK